MTKTGRFPPPHWREQQILQELMVRRIMRKLTFNLLSEGQLSNNRWEVEGTESEGTVLLAQGTRMWMPRCQEESFGKVEVLRETQKTRPGRTWKWNYSQNHPKGTWKAQKRFLYDLFESRRLRARDSERDIFHSLFYSPNNHISQGWAGSPMWAERTRADSSNCFLRHL